jgi:RNA polymerase sigma factor (sigma-70 family)
VATGAAVRELAAPLPGTRALEGLYEAHAPALRRRCLRLTRDGDAADDLMQEVFVRFISRFPEPPAAMNVGAYLHATARNVLWKQLRDSHEVSDGDIETTVGADDDIDVDPERSALLGEQQNLVRRCAAVLTGRQRRALTLRDVEGRSYSEIGSELGIGTGAVMQVISRARARLRVAVRRANVDLDNLAPECKAMLGPLSDYLDGRASSTEAEIESHLATCDDCCQTLASFQEAGSRLRGFLPLVPLGGVLSRFRGKLQLGGSQESVLATVATTHAPTLARIGTALGAGGDGPLGITGVGAMVTAAVIAVGGGGIVVAEHVTSASGHARVASAPHASAATAAARRLVVRPPRAAARTAPVARSHGGHPYSPRGATTPAARPRTASSASSQIATRSPTRPPATTTTPRGPVPSEPATASGETPLATPKPVRPPVPETPASEAPAANVPAIVPVVKVPIVTTPIVPPPVVTVPTVPTTPVLPPILPPAIPLGASSSFGVVAGSGVTNTGPSVLTGDIGSFPTLAITGLASLSLTGVNQAGGAVSQLAKDDLVTAYDNVAARPATETIAADLGGRTLAPGVYRSASSIGLTGALTLDGHGDPNAVFVFQAGSTVTTASASQVVLVNGARPCNVFWQVGSSATLGTGSVFRGNILAFTSITVTTGVTIDGRVLARNGAVTLDSDVISRSAC